ncbi:ATP-binding protein [Roseomonas sp. ACRSG]|nr:ATP-binding protein [Roseomonas sp. ACRSG]
MPFDIPPRSPRRLRADRRAAVWLALALVGGLAASLLAWAAGQGARREAWEALQAQTTTTATLNAALLRSELEKQRSLPFVLAEDPDLRAALATPAATRLEALNRKLERLRDGTGADVIYLIDTNGMTLAASNWQEEGSFVGNDYRFRQYFQDGMRLGAGEQFALGTVSQRPGLYISRRLGSAQAPMGVVVVKVGFEAVEDTWRNPEQPIYVTDRRGIVLLTNRPRWRFQTDHPLPPQDLAAIRDSLQFGTAPLAPLPLRPNPLGFDAGAVLLDEVPDAARARLPVAQATALLHAAVAVPSSDWQLHLLVPSEALLATEEAQRRDAVLGITLVLMGIAAFLLQRAGRARRRSAQEQAERQELEERVAARTAELTSEIAERERAEARLQDARETLRQANRLATLGQVAAGVAHEINQPLAAIRSYAGNAGTFLQRGETERARGNLETIARLCERVGGITDELRAFARKGTPPVGPVGVKAAAEGAAMLLRARLEHQGVPLLRDLPAEEAWINGRQVRLEQVLVNLIQNALDALEGQAGAEIRLGVTAGGGAVRITVADNGPGIPPEIMGALFMPFSTSKPQGLGLGLVICNDIVTEAGGRIEVVSRPGAGTTFTIILPEVQP